MDTQKKPIRAVRDEELREDEIDLIELFYYYLSRIKYIICALLLGAVIAGAVTHFLITPKYIATTKLYMVSASKDSVIDLTDLNLGTSLSQDYEVLMKIRPLAEDVIKELDLDYDYQELMSMITISAIEDTRVIEVTVESADPKEAMEIANEFADQTVTYLPKVMETDEPNIAERAILPEEPSSPSLTKNTMIGALAGIAICLAVLTVRFLMDDTIKTAEDVEKIFGVMPLTVIPEGEIKGFSKTTDRKNKSGKKRRLSKK